MPKPEEEPLRKGEMVVLGLAIAAGVLLRFWTTSHLWLDEALSVDIARLPIGDIPDALRHDGHPPLYYLILHGWMRVFGEGDAAVRALSGVIAVVTIPVIWFAGRRVGGRATGWAAVALLSLSPFAIRYATETRMYALVMLLVAVGYLLIAAALERATWIRLCGIAVVTGALLLSHYWAMWLVAATVAVLAWRVRAKRGVERTTTVRVLAATLAGGLFLVPWLGVMVDQTAHTGTPWADPARPTTIVATTVRDFGGGEFAEGEILGWLLVMAFAIGLFAKAIDRVRLEVDVRTTPLVRREALVVGLTFAIACVAGFVTRTTFASRYAAVIAPLFLLVAAAGVTRFAGFAARAVVVLAILSLGIVSAVHGARTDRTQMGEVADAIATSARSGDLVLVCPDQLGPALHRYLPDSLGLVQVSYPTLGDLALVDWRDYAERNDSYDARAVAATVASMVREGQTVWLVNSGAYKTFEGDCELLAVALSESFGAPALVVTEDADAFFEHGGLLQYPRASGRT